MLAVDLLVVLLLLTVTFTVLLASSKQKSRVSDRNKRAVEEAMALDAFR